MRQRMGTRAIRVVAMLLGLSLMLTACDPNELMQLVNDRLIDQEAAAAEADRDTNAAAGGEDSAKGDAATAGDGKSEKREFQCLRGGAPTKAPAEADDAAGDGKPDAASDKPVADKPASDKPVADKPVADKSAADKSASDKPAADKSADTPSGSDGGSSSTVSAIEKQIFDTLNATRREAGLRALSLSGGISDGAREWSCDMARTGDFRHADLRAAGVNGENIAWGYRSAAAVHQGWMNSDGHRRNRMSASWTEYGIGVCKDGAGQLYYTERFR